MKHCGRCRTEKPGEAFNRCASKPDGLQTRCRDCQRAYRSRYYQKNRDAEQDQCRSYYSQNADAIRARRKANYRAHPERERAWDERWREKNAESLRLYRIIRNATVKPWRKWRANNPEKAREQCRRQQARRWFAAKANPISYNDIYERDGGICYLCLKPARRKSAHFDHVSPLCAGGSHTYDNVRTTHAACNLRKGRSLVSPGAFVRL